jgi:hypothetical protein
MALTASAEGASSLETRSKAGGGWGLKTDCEALLQRGFFRTPEIWEE